MGSAERTQGICWDRSEPSPSATRSFPQFQKLPPELQDMIWEAAMRGNKPCFHAFLFKPRLVHESDIPDYYGDYVVIHDYTSEDARSERIYGVSNSSITRPDPLRTIFLDIPVDTTTECSHNRSINMQHKSMNLQDKSMYLQDYGLWTACKSSRLSMTRRHVKGLPAMLTAETQGDQAATVSSPPKARKPFSAAVTGYFKTGTSSTPHVFHIAKQDLVLVHCNWATDMWTWNGIPSVLRALAGVDNLSMEYRDWMVEELEDSQPTLVRDGSGAPIRVDWGQFASVSYFERLETTFSFAFPRHGGNPDRRFWFIDDTIKRRQGPTPIDYPSFAYDGDEPRRVFYGKGCKFTEVGWDDYHPGEGKFCGSLDSTEYPCGAPSLIRVMARTLDPNARGNGLDDLCRWLSSVPFGILAVEDE
ncbi:hypothetical protein V8F20_001895 [Naviculisporaceae sp. PSN 640]